MERDRSSISEVRAIIVSWNSGAWLERCVSSLVREELDANQVWIVDHGTTDGSLDDVSRSRHGVNVVRHPANRSYGEAVNLAAKRCGGEYLLVLNPDTELHDGCLDALVGRMQSDPGVAAVGPTLIDERGREVTRYSRTRSLQLLASLATPGVFSGWRNRLRWRGDRKLRSSPVEFLEASVVLISRSAFDLVGGFDEQFTFYGEDADLSWTFRRHGFALWHETSAMALHAGSTAFGTMRDRQRQAFVDGYLMVARKQSLRRYRWERRWVLALLRVLELRALVDLPDRVDAIRSLIGRVQAEAYLPSVKMETVAPPSITVVIPTYQRPECVARLLDSLNQQDDTDFDVLLVIQGNDETYEKALSGRHDRFPLRRIVLSRPSRPIAKNAGARAVTADIVLFCDDDIEVPRAFIRAHRRAFVDPGRGAVSCRVVEVGLDDNSPSDRLRLTWYGRIVANTHSRRSGPAEVAAGGNMSVRRELLLSFGGFEPLMRGTANLEEFDVCERIRFLGWNIWFDGSTTVKHQPQPGGNVDVLHKDPAAYYRDLHHNLGLLVGKHRPVFTIPVVAAWALARSVRKALEHRWTPEDAFRVWWKFVEGWRTYRAFHS